VQKALDYFKNRPNSNLLGLVFNRVKLARHYDYYASHTYQQKMRQSQKAEQKPGLLKQLFSFGKSQQEDSETLTLAEVADQLGISQTMARRWCEDGRLPAEKAGRQWLVHLEDLNDFITNYQSNEIEGDFKSLPGAINGAASAQRTSSQVEPEKVRQ
jgi:excisionase family DNA binding protein